MVDLLKWMISFAFALPLVSLVILFVILRVVVKNKKKSILMTVDLSTIFFIMSVHFHLITIFEQSFLIYIILGLMSLLFIVFYVDYKTSKAPSMKSVSKKVWRLSFLFFFISYLILTVCGMISSIIKNAFI
jgi:quinol-cytochrome oxidoreductase complex cytochrome b subunit